jgi:hypothetical protein
MAVLYVNYYNNEDYALAVISSQIALYTFVKEHEGYEFVDKYHKQIMIYGISPKFQDEKDVLKLKDQRIETLCDYVQSQGIKVMIRDVPGTPWKQYTTMKDVHRAITHNY